MSQKEATYAVTESIYADVVAYVALTSQQTLNPETVIVNYSRCHLIQWYYVAELI